MFCRVVQLDNRNVCTYESVAPSGRAWLKAGAVARRAASEVGGEAFEGSSCWVVLADGVIARSVFVRSLSGAEESRFVGGGANVQASA